MLSLRQYLTRKIIPLPRLLIAGPAYRLTRERMIEIGPDLAAMTREISQEISMAAIPT